MESRKYNASKAPQLFGRCRGQIRPFTVPEAASRNTRKSNVCRMPSDLSSSSMAPTSASHPMSLSSAGVGRDTASSSFRFLNPPRAGWTPNASLSVKELMPPRSGWMTRSSSRGGMMPPSAWEALPNRPPQRGLGSPPAPPNSIWETSRVGGAPATRAELPPRELISQAIRRILEEPPQRRPQADAVEELPRTSRRKRRRTAPTSGYSHRYPPGLLADSSDEGMDADWYPKRWEDVLGPAVANLPPTHFYRSWRTNSRGLLRYLLGEKLDEQQFARTQEPDASDECYGIYTTPRGIQEEEDYEMESRSK